MQPLETNDPTLIGPYRLLGRIGVGGMGRVYLGRSPGGRTVAVKVVRPDLASDTEFRTRFQREVDAARRAGGTTRALSAPVLDADTDSPVPWIATGYVAGPALSDAVAEFGPLPLVGLRVLGAGLGEALVALHGMGLIHRDVKPSNVLLTLDGPVLIDFGIARAMDATTSVTGNGVVVGSPGYLAPEQVTGGRTGPASDVFSLGAVLVHAASGHGPFSGDSTAVLLYKVVHEQAELDGVPGELCDVVEACLAKDPGLRPTPAEIAERLAPGGGPAALVREGWLPSPLMEQLGRHAVELLDLDAAPPPSLPSSLPFPPPPSLPAPLPLPPPAPEPKAAYGSFGPPSSLTGPPDALPQGAVPETVRGGRLNRTVAVLGVAALLAVGAAVAAWLLTRPDGEDTSGDGKPSASASASASLPPSAPASANASVPSAFLGTWKGAVIQADGTPNGSMVVTLTHGAKGADVARTTYSVLGIECRSRGALVGSTATRLTISERGHGNGDSALCTGDPATVTFTTVPGENHALDFRSDDAAGGSPHARLTRVGG